MSSLLFPLCTFFLLCLCIAYWASTAVYPFLFLILFLFPARLLPRSARSPQEWNLKSLRFNPKQPPGWKSSSGSFGEGGMEPGLALGLRFRVWI